MHFAELVIVANSVNFAECNGHNGREWLEKTWQIFGTFLLKLLHAFALTLSKFSRGVRPNYPRARDIADLCCEHR